MEQNVGETIHPIIKADGDNKFTVFLDDKLGDEIRVKLVDFIQQRFPNYSIEISHGLQNLGAVPVTNIAAAVASLTIGKSTGPVLTTETLDSAVYSRFEFYYCCLHELQKGA